MARRYHQSRKDRRDESRGMERYERELKDTGHHHDERRRKEYEDSMMIHEDHSEIANLPQEVIMRKYPHGHYGHSQYIDDGIRGIDDQMLDDAKEMSKQMKPEKY